MRNRLLANISLDGLIYLILGLIWLIAQIAGAAARGRRRRALEPSIEREPGQQRGDPEPDDDAPDTFSIDPETSLQSFLEDLVKRRGSPDGASDRATPSPRTSPPVARRRPPDKASALETPSLRGPARFDAGDARVGRAAVFDPPQVAPHRRAPQPADATAVSAAIGQARFSGASSAPPGTPLLSFPGMSLPRVPVVAPPLRGSFASGAGAEHRAPPPIAVRSPRGLRDAIVLKALLDPPRALTPPGATSWLDPRRG